MEYIFYKLDGFYVVLSVAVDSRVEYQQPYLKERTTLPFPITQFKKIKNVRIFVKTKESQSRLCQSGC